MARFLSQLAQYQANNNGKVPASTTAYNSPFITQYLQANGNDTFNDPSTGSVYVVKDVTKCTGTNNGCPQKSKSTTTTDGQGNQTTDDTGIQMGNIYVYTNARCDGENPVYIQGDRKIAITLKLEGAGIYCGNN